MIRVILVQILALCVLTLRHTVFAQGNVGKDVNELRAKLSSALNTTQSILDTLFTRWQVDKYPNFLQSAAMTKTSFDVLKLKFEHRILTVATSVKDERAKFVVSFMGSSVTAGHDSPFEKSFPVLTQKVMAPAFEPLGIDLETRNAAMGNNPCMPYDICVRTFAGTDADIVHWEQSYNCMQGKEALLEEFVRQCIQMPSRPVVVFSDSATPNWKEDQCKDNTKQKESLDEKERTLLEAYQGGHYEELICNLNKGEVRRWGDLQKDKDILSNYKIAGIQLFQHSSHEAYKCMGPYVKDWQCCSASWHPSLLGHELRAAHHAFTWLLIYKEAIKSIQKELDDSGIPLLFEKASKHIAKEVSFIPEAPLYQSKISNEMQCFTNYEPRADVGMNLSTLVVNQGGWKDDVFENFISETILKKAKERGYKDVKYLLYGNKDSGKLSLQIITNKSGFVFLCQTPGEWGKLPGPNARSKKGFKNFWDAGTKVYLAENTNGHQGYTFDAAKVKEIKYTHASKDTQDICVYFDEEIPKGTHILTIEPTTEENIIVSLLLLP